MHERQGWRAWGKGKNGLKGCEEKKNKVDEMKNAFSFLFLLHSLLLLFYPISRRLLDSCGDYRLPSLDCFHIL